MPSSAKRPKPSSALQRLHARRRLGYYMDAPLYSGPQMVVLVGVAVAALAVCYVFAGVSVM
jgi:hypothetical protein